MIAGHVYGYMPFCLVALKPALDTTQGLAILECSRGSQGRAGEGVKNVLC